MQRLIEVVYQEGLFIEEQASLPEGFYGLYYQEDDFYPVVSLSKEIYGQCRLENVVLAEEIGHHLTTTEYCLPKYFKNYSHRISITRQEYRAMRKGSQLLIYPEEILDAVSHGIEEIWELAEHFNVTDDFMAFRMAVWEKSGR